MEDKPKISVILPAYNAEKYVAKTLESLLTQTLKEVEFICINDGSKDGTLKVLKKFEQNDERIKIIDKKNEGVWKARIDGIKAAKGTYISFIDADDNVEATFLEELYKNITKNNADISICGFKRIDEKNGKVLSQEMKYEENKIIENGKNFEEIISINTALWNKLYRTELLKQIKDLSNPPRILEDMMFLCMIYEKAKKISFVNKYLYNYMVIEGSAMNTLKKEEIENIQNAMLEVKKQYVEENESNEKMEILSSMAFLHFGISLMLKASGANNCNFGEEYKKNLEFLNENFPEWKKTKYTKIIYCLKNKSANLKLAIVRKVYICHLFKVFILTYKFITKTLKIDIKW